MRDLNFLESFPEIEIDKEVTPLIVAAHLGRVEIVKLLLENESINVNVGSNDLLLTPLCVACAAGNFETAELLIQNGADPNKADNLCRPPLYFCFIRLQEDVNQFENHLICMKMANMLLQHAADINFIVNKEKHKTLLMEYCGVMLDMNSKEKETNLKVIKFLLEHGADATIKSKKGKTAFDYSQNHPFKVEVQNLLKNTRQVYTHINNHSRTTSATSQQKIKKLNFFSTEGKVTSACCSIFDCCKKK